MDFNLTSLLQAFDDAEFKATREDFALYAFVLATEADRRIFPELLLHFSELHLLTADEVLIIAPQILMDEYPDSPMDASEVAQVLRSGLFSNYQTVDHYGSRHYADVSAAVQRFLYQQAVETYRLATHCGITLDRLPCILFFSSLQTTSQFVAWSIKDQDAWSVIQGFRALLARTRAECKELLDALHETRSLRSERARLDWQIGCKEQRLRKRLDRQIVAGPRRDEYVVWHEGYAMDAQLVLRVEEAKRVLVSRLDEHRGAHPHGFPFGRIIQKIQELIVKPFDMDASTFISAYLEPIPNADKLFKEYLNLVRSQERWTREERRSSSRLRSIDSITAELSALFDPLKDIDGRIATCLAQRKRLAACALSVVSSLDRSVLESRKVELLSLTQRQERGSDMLELQSFIVHGHDRALLFELKDYIQNTLRLAEPIILAQQPDGGSTIIEKFEKYAERVDVAFVLLTPDDATASADGGQAWRARQNVIFELGYFVCKFGRRSGRTIILYKGSLDIPSDLSGVIYIDVSEGIRSAGETIRRELQSVISQRLSMQEQE